MFSLLAQLGIDSLSLGGIGSIGGGGGLFLLIQERQRRIAAEEEVEELQSQNESLHRKIRRQSKSTIPEKGMKIILHADIEKSDSDVEEMKEVKEPAKKDKSSIKANVTIKQIKDTSEGGS